MSPSNLVWSGGGLASIVAGIQLLLGHVLNLGGYPEYGDMEKGGRVSSPESVQQPCSNPSKSPEMLRNASRQK